MTRRLALPVATVSLGGAIMPKIAIVAFCIGAGVAMLAGVASAQTADLPPRSPLTLGGTRLTTKVPDPDNWTSRFDKGKTIYTCKPLACADAVSVTVTPGQSPTRNPNPQALEKLAKVDLPKRMKAITAAASVMSEQDSKLETLTSKVTSMLGYPSIEDEMKLTRGKTAMFLDAAVIFAGPLMVTVTATSPDRAVAVKSLNDFIGGMKIDDGPGLPSKPALAPSTPAPTKI
jgi:hypothetical protein